MFYSYFHEQNSIAVIYSFFNSLLDFLFVIILVCLFFLLN